MRIALFLTGFLFSAVFVSAQTSSPIYSTAQQPVAQTSGSSIDLLKSSFSKSNVASSASDVPASKPAPTVAQTLSQKKEEAAQAGQNDPSQKTVSGPAEEKAVEKKDSQQQEIRKQATQTAAAPNLLDMPLAVGDTSTAVQATVEPVKKSKASKSAKRATQVKTKKSGAVQAKAVPTELEKDIERSNALLPKSQQPDTTPAQDEAQSEEEAQADAELEFAVRMLEKSKEKAASADRKIPPSAAQNKPAKVPAPNKKFNPNAFRPGVTWQESKSTHFIIYTQKRSSGISSSNMSMTFESAYQTLRRFIPWMMSGKVRVFVYQDHQSYLRHEPNARAWTRALAYPTRGEIVVYDEPGKNQELKEVFTHELTHIFTQQFFDKHKTGRIMTPTWLDEGLAVMMEDQAYNGSRGGPWANDFRTLNFQRHPSEKTASFASTSLFGSGAKKFKPISQGKKTGKPLYFTPFGQFMAEGSLDSAEGQDKVQDWYFQAYTMVRFLLNPAGGSSPSNRMQFEQFTRLLSQGEALRDPSTGFLVKDARGKTVYQPYSVEKALGKAYRYSNISNFEDSFWRWANK